MGDDGHQVTGRRSPRPRTPDPPAAAKEIEFGLPTPTTPCFGFRDRGNGSEDDWGISAQLTVTTSQSDPVRLSPAWRVSLDLEQIGALSLIRLLLLCARICLTRISLTMRAVLVRKLGVRPPASRFRAVNSRRADQT